MKKIIYILTILFTMIACGTSNKNNWYNIGNEGILINTINTTYTRHQIDSLCLVDSLSNNLEKDWNKIVFKNANNNTIITQYTYRKPYKETTYVITSLTDSTYNMTKRQLQNK